MAIDPAGFGGYAARNSLNGITPVARLLRVLPPIHSTHGTPNGWDTDITIPADIPFIVEQISKCRYLAEICADREIADRLYDLAREFARRAIQLGADPALIPEIPAAPGKIAAAAVPAPY